MNVAKTNFKVMRFHGIGMRVWNMLDEPQRHILRMEYIEYSIPGEPLLKALKEVMEWWGDSGPLPADSDCEMPSKLFGAAWKAIKEAEASIEPMEGL